MTVRAHYGAGVAGVGGGAPGSGGSCGGTTQGGNHPGG